MATKLIPSPPSASLRASSCGRGLGRGKDNKDFTLPLSLPSREGKAIGD
ncbi:MAG: hypothetical protein V1890_06355 [Candidatus Zixiibacteriota bacterium]